MTEIFGRASAIAIMRKFLIELKGMRLNFPTNKDIYREERNRKILSLYHGNNEKELAIMFGISVTQVYKIIKCN